MTTTVPVRSMNLSERMKLLDTQMNPQENSNSLHSRKIMNRRRPRQHPPMIRINTRNNGMNLPLEIRILINHQTIKMEHLQRRSLHSLPIVTNGGGLEFP